MVNTELIGLYWRIGRLLLDRRAAEGWGTAVVERLAADLRAEFPGMRGFSPRNLAYMRSLAQAYPTVEVLQQPAARLPWGRLMVLLDKVDDPVERDWYAGQAVSYGWLRAVLSHHLGTQRYRWVGAAPRARPEREGPVAVRSDCVPHFSPARLETTGDTPSTRFSLELRATSWSGQRRSPARRRGSCASKPRRGEGRRRRRGSPSTIGGTRWSRRYRSIHRSPRR